MIATRTEHPFWMYDELLATPDALERALTPADAEQAHRADLVRRLQAAKRIYLTGCGTAYHAALVGASLLGALSDGKVHARAVQAFELAHYEQPGPGLDDVLIALSHSGQPTATRAALERARQGGAFCLTVTGNPQSYAAQLADAVLDEGYAEVKSFAYTISYSLMVALLADLAGRLGAALGTGMASAAAVAAIPAMHRAALALDADVRALAERLGEHGRWIVAGAGGNYATALETSLKMQETSYVAAFGMQLEEVLHGPVAALGDSVLVVIAPPGAARTRAHDVLRAARLLGAPTVALGAAGDGELAEWADSFLGLPECAEALSPAPYHVPLHLLSYWLSAGRGRNPDLMRREDARYLEARRSYTL